jgi:hypothetical protein
MRAAERPIPRGALTQDEAAVYLGIGRKLFRSDVLPELAVVRLGSRTLIPIRELNRFLDRHAARVLE